MWKEYSISFIKKNRASTVSTMVAAFIASLLLSLLCSFFYNMWVYDVESVILETGDWHGRIVGAFAEEDLNLIRGFANVEKVVIREENAGEAGALPQDEALQNVAMPGEDKPIAGLDLYFYQPRTIYEDITLLSERLGLQEGQVTYNYQLLAMYFIRIPGDSAPRMLLPLYFVVVMIMCFSLILVIHNSFAVSMNARIHQLGILSGIGATPGQIRICLLQEAAALCVLPLFAGSMTGIVLGYGMLRMMSDFALEMTQRHDLAFRYHPAIFVLTMLISAVTVMISAWIPAWKLAKLTPLQAIRGMEELTLKRRKHSPLLSFLFGMEGELAGNALKAQKKALRTSTLSLTLSFLGFTVILCFFTLSGISTEYTYFAKYQDTWDVMAMVKDAELEELDRLNIVDAMQEAEKEQGASSCVAYQKAYATARIRRTQISDELSALGGLEAVAGERVTAVSINIDEDSGEKQTGADKGERAKNMDAYESRMEEAYYVQSPIMIMDDTGFMEYCVQAGITPGLDGAVVINRIWDSLNSNFRYRQYVPFLKENVNVTTLQNIKEHNGIDEVNEKSAVQIPVLAYTDVEPLLREEYEDYSLVHVVPVSLWKDISSNITGVEPDVYIRVLAERSYEPGGAGQGKTPQTAEENLAELELPIAQLIGQTYETEIENRVQEKHTNDRLILGYKIVLGTFCTLLAVIGIANIFSYTMGFLRQRRREFARYLSVGMTPAGLRKMFRIEILVIAGRPVLITLPLTVIFVEMASRASYLNSVEFWVRAPFLPVAVFIAAIFGFVMLAYFIGGKRILQDNLADALRSDMME